MISFDRPLTDGASAALHDALFLVWDKLPGAPSLQDALLAHLIRQRLQVLPSNGPFDFIDFRLSGQNVTLTGVATHPALAADALRTLAKVPVLNRVFSLIETIPPSVHDDMIRAESYARIYADPRLEGYRAGISALGFHSIRILVRDGVLALAGFVASDADRQHATALASSVHGVVAVENLLQIASNRN